MRKELLPVGLFLEILDALANIATVMGLALALVKEHKLKRMEAEEDPESSGHPTR